MSNIINYAFGFIGIILAIYFYWKGKRRKVPVYSSIKTNLISDQISNLEGISINLKGEPINNLSIVKIAFWNSGYEPIERYDIETKNPLSIEVENNAQILFPKILYQSTLSNDLALKQLGDKTKCQIMFQFLNHGQGTVIQFALSGNISSEIKIVGDIRGVDKISKLSPHSSDYYLIGISILPTILIIGSSAAFIFFGSLISQYSNELTQSIISAISLSIGIVGSVFLYKYVLLKIASHKIRYGDIPEQISDSLYSNDTISI